MVDLDALEAQLATIRDAFIADLPQREKRIADAWQVLAESNWTEQAVQSFHREVHSLSGTGATFGCDDLSKRARALEHKFLSIHANNTPASAQEMAELQSLYSELQAEISRVTGDQPAG